MNKTSILYAEDDRVTRENYALVLKSYFSKVHTAKDGKEALALYYSEKPDALMLDINMPIMDGLEVIEAVRKENSEIPIVVLSAHSDREKLLRAIPLGLTRYLVKPAKDESFREALTAILQQTENKDIVLLGNDLRYNKTHQELVYRNAPVKLSQKEKRLLYLLADRAGHFIPQDLLITDIWFNDEIDETHIGKLSQLIYRLHIKLSEITGEKMLIIENSYAHGYRLIT